MTRINRLLVANRGEIACRVMRTARRMGVETVAVYSDADADAPHVHDADYSVRIGPAPVGESYLLIDNIISAAIETDADAIHPGYGFLSENADFARACAEAGIIFIGPPAGAIAVMGDKARSKRAMIEAGVPCVPGYQGDDQATKTLIDAATKIGCPLMVKASAGGGGRGMRLVHELSELESAIGLAKSEALNAFGSDHLIIEKAIIRPRHVEIQVFGDSHGNIIHLGERDCSVQRRHQKVLEEAPCPVMTEERRAEMGAAAVRAAAAVDYVGAGTVEFLLGEDGAFYFLEMNTRLQVEHPVTEAVTGLDLVQLQIKVAEGAPLGVAQDDVTLNGHAIEARLYAEDPRHDFLPSTGKIDHWHAPTGDGVRLDAGVRSGGEVSPHYDSMVAKVIGIGATREEARRRLVQSLKSSALIGPETNRDFLIDALERSAFREGRATTAFIGEEYGEEGFTSAPDREDLARAAAIHYRLEHEAAVAQSLGIDAELFNWSSSAALESHFSYRLGEEPLPVRVSPDAQGVLNVTAGAETIAIEILELGDDTALIRANGRKETVIFHQSDAFTLTLATGSRQFTVHNAAGGEADADETGGGLVRAPMHGLLLELFAAEGDAVAKGQRLAVLEAMKMQHEIIAEVDGEVATVSASAGAQIAADDLIMEITPTAEG